MAQDSWVKLDNQWTTTDEFLKGPFNCLENHFYHPLSHTVHFQFPAVHWSRAAVNIDPWPSTLIHCRLRWPWQFYLRWLKILHCRDRNESSNSHLNRLMLNHLKWNNSFNSGCYRWKIQFYGYSSFRNMLRVESRNHSKQFIIYAANGNVGWYSFVPNITALYNIYYNMVSWFHFVKKCSIRSPKCSTQPKPRFQQSETTFKRSYLTQWMFARWTIDIIRRSWVSGLEKLNLWIPDRN